LEQVRRGATSQPTDADASAEAELVEAAKALSDDAWEEIYRRHAQQVYTYIYFRIGDQHTAEDLAADVFVKAIAGIKGYVWRGTPLLAWLYRIAHNVAIDHRKAAARRAKLQAASEMEDVEEPRDRIRELDETTDMMRAIQSLTADQQQVILLRFYDGLSSAEVAGIMNKPEGAIKALQARGVRSLKRVLTQRADEAVA
jgi:RNA polymerase sigma-70 factor (ECF subfamily)